MLLQLLPLLLLILLRLLLLMPLLLLLLSLPLLQLLILPFSLTAGVLYGPLHSEAAVEAYKKTIAEAKELGGKIEYGGNVSDAWVNMALIKLARLHRDNECH